jgi:menaquinol-cytochrome c reductase iron-sulfur subunit
MKAAPPPEHPPVPDRRKPPKSRYTAERNVPGAFEGETVTRRRFMTGTAHGMGGLAAAAFTLPALGFAIGPVFERGKWAWQAIGAPGDFPNDSYVPRIITIVNGIGEAGKTTIYVRRRNPQIDTDKYNRDLPVVAISTRCMHLGCPVRFTQAAARFICPCHGGVYDFQGIRTGGPPVRPLDRFYTRITNGQVEVGPRFSVNSQLKRFPSPRDPGEDLDGIGQYLYPGRFSTPKK